MLKCFNHCSHTEYIDKTRGEGGGGGEGGRWGITSIQLWTMLYKYYHKHTHKTIAVW